MARIVELARTLRAELVELRGGPLWADREAPGEPLEATLTAWLASPEWSVVVGCIDDAVLGYGVVEIETLRSGSRLGVIHELFVEVDARSVGVGEAMAGALVGFCRGRQCVGIDARALPGHRAAKNFFEEQGFKARAIVMHHELRVPDTGNDPAS
ncbi:MAG: GNAT family N-acetyltransferase [Acidimicrobiia bacterium]|nr:GNAT family N-acetyltransferase [Acidimicrobiia bacterium]